jgi:hypothetical protein
MPRIRTTLALAVAALATLPATALSKKPLAQPLKDVAPLGSTFKDRVLTTKKATAHASISGSWQSYSLPDGTAISAAISDRYANMLDPSVAQSYVDFLGSLDHGPELGSLKVYIAPPDEVTAECGGQDGTLACYDSSTQIMVVPGQETDTGTSGVTTSYVVAHEYGHHIAATRNNDPFNSFAVGPKYWSSYELVCDRAIKGLLAPGNETTYYLSNPGEGWAETYAQLKYPGVAWQYNPLMKPDAGAFAAAKKDVLTPWTHGASTVFKGRFGKSGKSTHQYKFELTLDGRMQVRLRGPHASNYNLHLTSNGRDEGSTSNSGSRDSFNYTAACREDQTEHVTLTVRRVSGSGPFTVHVEYAG